MEKNFEELSDEEICNQIHEGQKDGMDYLMNKYKGLVRKTARAYYLIGGETEDLIQEGMIGLVKAVRDYNPSMQVPFAGFAELCVSRQIYTAVRASRRKKHQPLNTYVSIYEPADDQEDSPALMDVLYDEGAGPEESYLNRHELHPAYEALLEILSPYEKKVLNLYIEGKSRDQIAQELGKSEKSVDNAISRIKSKASNLHWNT